MIFINLILSLLICLESGLVLGGIKIQKDTAGKAGVIVPQTYSLTFFLNPTDVVANTNASVFAYVKEKDLSQIMTGILDRNQAF